MAERLLQIGPECELLICEPDIEALYTVLGARSLLHILSSSRVVVVSVAAPTEIAAHIHGNYMPEYHRAPVIVPLRPMVAHNTRWRECYGVALHTVQDISANNSVHGAFGRVWTRNIILNSTLLSLPPPRVAPVRSAIVLAAGPTLDVALTIVQGDRPPPYEWPYRGYTKAEDGARTARDRRRFEHACSTVLRGAIASRKGGAREAPLLMAVDSALPALLARGIHPDIVVSIDAQLATYHHFLPSHEYRGVVIADSALSPSVVGALNAALYFGEGEHPLAIQLNRPDIRWPLESAAGNVTHSAVRVAVSLGCRSIELFGADYAYYRGKPYLRGSYLTTHFERGASRLRSAEQRALDYTMGWNKDGALSDTNVNPWSAPPHFRRYRRELVACARRHRVALNFNGAYLSALYEQGGEEESNQESNQEHKATERPTEASVTRYAPKRASKNLQKGRLLSEWVREMYALTDVVPPFRQSFQKLGRAQQEALVSCMPLMRHIAAHPKRYNLDIEQIPVRSQGTELQRRAQEIILNFMSRLEASRGGRLEY